MKVKSTICLSFYLMGFFLNVSAEEKSLSVLHNGVYHADEVSDVKNGETWTAIIKSNRQYVQPPILCPVFS